MTDPTNLGGLLSTLISSAQAGKWMAAVGVVLMLVTAGLRWLLVKKLPWFETWWGGAMLIFSTSLAATVGGSLAEGSAFSWELFLAALSSAYAATGVHTHVKKYLEH